MSRGTRRGHVVAVCLLLSTYGLNACSGGSEAEHRAPPASSPDPRTVPDSATDAKATTTTLAPTPEEQVEAAYLAAYRVLVKASTSPRHRPTDLPTVLVGDSLDHALVSLDELSERRLVVRYPGSVLPVPSIRKIEVTSPGLAKVTACLIDNGLQVNVDTEKVMNDLVVSKLSQSDLRLLGGNWKVSSAREIARWADNRGCNR